MDKTIRVPGREQNTGHSLSAQAERQERPSSNSPAQSHGYRYQQEEAPDRGYTSPDDYVR